MRKKDIKTAVKTKSVKSTKAKKAPMKKTVKTTSVKTKKSGKNVSKTKAVSKPNKIAKKVVSAKVKTPAKKKPALIDKPLSSAVKIAKIKKPVRKAEPKPKTLKAKTLPQKPVSRKVTKKPVKTTLKKVMKAPVKKQELKLKPAISGTRPKPSARTKKPSEKTKKAVLQKTTSKIKATPVKELKSRPALKKTPAKKPKTAVSGRTKTVKKETIHLSKTKTSRQIAIPEKTVLARKKSFRLKPDEKAKTPVKSPLKIFLPEKESVEEILQEVLYSGLPEEYGENDFFIIPIDPKYIFVNWEITKKTFGRGRGRLNIRAYDLTGLKSESDTFNRFFDIEVNTRTGNGFFEINMPGCDIIMEIGFLNTKGDFKAVMRSNRVSIPPLITFDKLGIAQKLYESGVPVGY